MSRELETHIELEVLITFNYYPGEPTTREDPGCNEECEIESVIINSPTRHPTSYPSIDILPALSDKQVEKLEQECIESLQSDE